MWPSAHFRDSQAAGRNAEKKYEGPAKVSKWPGGSHDVDDEKSAQRRPSVGPPLKTGRWAPTIGVLSMISTPTVVAQ